MSVKNGSERNAKRVWIPLVFGLAPMFAVGPGSSLAASESQTTALPVVEVAAASDETWQVFMRWLIQNLMIGLNCGSPAIPDDVPVAMLIVTDCYLSQGLRPMSPEERAEHIRTIDETLQAMQSSPSSVPLLTSIQFTTTLKLMRAEAELVQ